MLSDLGRGTFRLVLGNLTGELPVEFKRGQIGTRQVLHVRQDIRVEQPDRLIYLTQDGLIQENVIGGSGHLAVEASCLNNRGGEMRVVGDALENGYSLRGVGQEGVCEVKVRERVQLKATEIK